jgi:hypothetical protein
MLLGIEGAGGGAELLDDAPKECPQAAFFRGSHLGGNEEVGQTHQSQADGLQALLAVDEGRRRDGAGVWLRTQKIQGSLKESTAVLFVGNPIRANQRESLAELQAVAGDAAEKGILLGGRHGAQAVSYGGAELS